MEDSHQQDHRDGPLQDNFQIQTLWIHRQDERVEESLEARR